MVLTVSNTENHFHVSDRAGLRQVRWWHRLAYIQRKLPLTIKKAIDNLSLKDNCRVLDFGCADLPYKHCLPPTARYVGADITGNPNADAEILPNGRLPDNIGDFDAILSTQVLEHVADPALYLAEAYRVLRPGGKLLLSTHGIMIYHPDPVDYWRWTGAGLIKVIGDSGFKAIQLEGMMGLAPTGLQLFLDATHVSVPRLLRRPYTLVFQLLIAATDRLHSAHSRRMNALVYIVTAQKPDMA